MRDHPLWLRLLLGPIGVAAVVVLLSVACCRQVRGAEPREPITVHAGSDGWPVPQGQASGTGLPVNVTRQAQPLTLERSDRCALDGSRFRPAGASASSAQWSHAAASSATDPASTQAAGAGTSTASSLAVGSRATGSASSLIAVGCGRGSPILRIQQSGYLTHGAVVHSDLRGCLILTCKHSRNPRDPWRAGKLSGTRTLLDQHHDLALLISTDLWRGPVLQIADAEPPLPVVFLSGPTLPRTLPWGTPMTLSDLPCKVGDGSSGTPLLVGGKVAGVRVGPDLEGRAVYIPRAAVVRFLK